MAGLYTTFKVFTPGEILTAADLNSSEQQHVTYNTALATRGYSETLEQSRVQAPTTSLALSVADELARLREKLRLLGGVTYWDQIVGPSLSPFALPKGQVLLPLEGATLPDGTSGNAFPTVSERISTATIPPGNTQPKIVEVIYDFDATTPQYLMWKIKTPLGYKPGELVEVILTFSVVPPAAEVTPVGDKFRPVVGVAPVRDELDNPAAAVTTATMFGPDNVLVPTGTFQKEYRIALPTTNITEDQKCIIVVGCLPATLDNYAGKRRLEAVVVEFSRGAFQLEEPGMQNPMEQLGDIITGGNTGTPQRLPVGVEEQILTVSAGIPQWVDPPGGFNNPMTQAGDLIQGGTGGDASRLPIGPSGYVLTAVSGVPTWEALPASLANPMTTEGDIIYQNLGVPARLGASVNGLVLTMVSGYPAWATPPVGFTNPMTTLGDVITGGAAGAAQRLGVGTEGFVLTIVGGVPSWAAAPGAGGGMTNPMTTQWDLIVGGAAGAPVRLAKGTDTFVLTMVAGAIVWAAPTGGGGGMTNPMTTVGDIIIGGTSGTPTRLGVGANTQVLTLVAGVPSWQTPASGGMTNPMTTAGDMIYGTASGAATRFAAGSANSLLVTGNPPTWTNSPIVNQLTVVDVASVTTPAAGRNVIYAKLDKKVYTKDDSGLESLLSGMVNPMISAGDIIIGGASGTPTRLGVGTNGHVLTLVAGVPTWSAGGGVTFPLLAPPGSMAAPSYAFAAESGVGLFVDGAGHLTLAANSHLVVFARAGTTSWYIAADHSLIPGVDSAMDVGSATVQARNIYTIGTTMPITAPASIPTPASGKVTIFSNTDKHLWEKDDTGASRRVGAAGGGSNYVRLPIGGADLPDGSTDNRPAEFVRDVSTGTLGNGPKVTRTYAKYANDLDRSLAWTFIIPSNWVGGSLVRFKWKGSVAGTAAVVWKAGAAAIVDGTTADGTVNYAAVDLSAPINAPATAGNTVETTITITATNFAAGRQVTVFIGRDVDHVSDLYAGDAILTSLQFEYS